MKATTKKYFSLAITRRFLEARDFITRKSNDEREPAAAFDKKVNIITTNISRLRTSKGEHTVPVEALGRICEYYDISPTWLLTGKGKMIKGAELLSANDALESHIDDIEKALGGIESLLNIIKSASNKNSNKTQKKRTK